MTVHANAIVSLDALKERLEEKSEKNDRALENMLDHFSNLLEIETGHPIKQRTLTDERFDGTGTAEILIPRTPVQSVTSFEIHSPLDDSTIQTISDTSKFWIADKRSGLVRLKETVFTEGIGNIVTTCSVGFLTTDIEWRTFENALYAALLDFYPRWERNELSAVSKSHPDGSMTYIAAAALPPIAIGMVRGINFAMGI